VTLDPLKLGERPDDSPNLEPTDPVPPSIIEVHVQNADSQPIAEAKVRVQIRPERDNYRTRFDRSVVADIYGIARINYPPSEKADGFEVSATHDDYASRKVVWSPLAGDTIPSSYTLKLRAGVTIGGIVVDVSDTPITGSKLSLHRFWSGGDEMRAKGEQPEFASRTTSTDAQGVWQAKGLPAELLDHISFDVKHENYIGTNVTVGANDNTEKELRAGTFKIRLAQGLSVRGRVVDGSERPVEGAQVALARKYYRERQETKTDADGRFIFNNAQLGSVPITVLAKSYKPALKDISVKADMDEVLIKLEPGSIIRGSVRNDAGEPIPEVRVALEGHGVPSQSLAEALDFSTTTDAKGQFVWDGAPDEPMSFYIGKQGYEQKRNQILKPNEDNLITLRKGRKIEGWVLDATTEKPVTKFRVGVGRYQGMDHFYADYPGMKDFADPNGMFTLTVSEEENNAIKAEADDYAEKIEKLPEAQNGVVQVVLRLKSSPSLRGVVLGPEGAPVAGASVAFASTPDGGGFITFRNGRFTSYQGKVVTTDASGQFTLSSPPESGLVVAAAGMGFTSATIPQVRDSGRLVLQAFGRIEGTFRVGGQPVAGQEFMFSMTKIGISFDWGSYKATTDDQGRFSIGKIPSGEGQVVRLVKSGVGSWLHSHATDVVVEPGQTTQVTLGDTGAVLKGQVRFETPPADGEILTVSGNLNTQMPPHPPQFQSQEEATAFFNSPEWKERTRNQKHFGVVVNEDGSLTVDSIPPGTYTLSVNAARPGTRPWESTPVAQGQTTVTVPENATPYSPITLGEIILRPVPQAPKVGR
jgi:hypothetical protein